MPKKTGAQKHIHKYYKMQNDLFACGLPNCTHFMPGNVEFMMLGKTSICWKCNERYIFGDRQLKMDKPECDECYLKEQGLNIDASDLMNYIESKTKVTESFKVNSDKSDNNEDELV